MLALRKADVQEFFAEFVKFTLFFGFFYWILKNGPYFSDTIIKSLRQIGDAAAGTSGMSPSGVVDVGFRIWAQAINNLSIWSPVDSFVGTVLSLGVLIMLALTAINMMMILVSAWVLMYGGIFLLGFGGSRWTSDIAINYFKTVLGVAMQLFGMVLLVGIGIDLLSSFYNQMGQGGLNFKDLGVMLTFCLALLVLSSKIPAMLAGVLTGSGIGNVGNMTAGGVVGAALGGAAVASAAVATAGAALAAGTANIVGGAQALMAAFSKANAAESAGAGAGSMMNAVGGSAGVGDAASGSALAAAMGGGVDSNSSVDPRSSYGSNSGSSSSSDSSASNTSAPGNSEPNSSDSMAGAAGPGSADGCSKAGVSPDSSPAGAAAADAAGGSSSDGKRGNAIKAAGAIAAKVGRVAAGSAGNLALGTYDVAKAGLGNFTSRALNRIGETTGGKIATAIKARGVSDQTATFGDDSLSAAEPADREGEVAAFRDRA